MVEKPSIAFDFPLVYTDGPGEYLDQVVMHLLFVLVDRILPGHVSWVLHILLGQEGQTALEEFDTLRVSPRVVPSQEQGDFPDPWIEVRLSILYLLQNIISGLWIRDGQLVVATLHKGMGMHYSNLRWRRC